MRFSESNSAISNFAEELQQAREFRRVTLSEVAASTRIQAEFLSAIERGTWEEVPAAYLRGYIAAYAAAVGMNKEKVLASFDRLTKSEEGTAFVRVESSTPLLKGPQHVELTRSKIRAEWFAALYRRRYLAYLLSIGLVVATYYFVRHAGAVKGWRDIQPVSFERAYEESFERPGAPFRVAGGADTVSSKVSDQLLIIANRRCAVVLVREGGGLDLEHLSEFDTLRFDRQQYSEVHVSPAGVAQLFNSDHRAIGSTDARGDTTIYAMRGAESAMIAQESMSIDSLRSGETPP